MTIYCCGSVIALIWRAMAAVLLVVVFEDRFSSAFSRYPDVIPLHVCDGILCSSRKYRFFQPSPWLRYAAPLITGIQADALIARLPLPKD